MTTDDLLARGLKVIQVVASPLAGTPPGQELHQPLKSQPATLGTVQTPLSQSGIIVIITVSFWI